MVFLHFFVVPLQPICKKHIKGCCLLAAEMIPF